MSSDQAVTPTFTAGTGPTTHTLVVTRSGNGNGSVASSPVGISCGTTCSANFTSGTPVTLTATPTAGSTFTGWSGDCSGSATCQVTMSSDHNVTATFAAGSAGTQTLSVTRAGGGSGSVSSSPSGISCGSTCSASFTTGTVVTLTATPASGSTFSGWSGGGCSGTGTCTVTMSSAQAVKATFSTATVPNHTLSVTRAGGGTGAVSSSPSGISCGTACSGSFTAGTVVALTATPASGSTFAGWSGGGCSGTGTCNVTMSSDESVTATFAQVTAAAPSCTLSVKSSKIVLKAKTKAQKAALGKLLVGYRCDAGASLTLHGVVTVKAGKSTKSTKSHSLGVVKGTAVAGVPGTLTLKLPASVLKAIKSHAKVSVSLTLTATNANGAGRATTKATLRGA
jgi:hypothetical protein